jgi:membrane fusion protein, adhesin transport system
VLLGRVKLGYELWRQFNGFPPVVTAPDQAKTETGKKDSK